MPLPGIMGRMRGASVRELAFSITEIDADMAGRSTYNLSVSTGAADEPKLVVIGFELMNTSTFSVSSVSITPSGHGSQSMAQAAYAVSTGGNRAVAALYYALIPGGTTASIQISLSGSSVHCAYIVGVATGDVVETPVDTATDDAGDPLTASIDVPAGGFAMAVACGFAGSNFPPCSWSGLTEQVDQGLVGNNGWSAAADAFASAQTGLSVSCNHGGSQRVGLAVASWGT